MEEKLKAKARAFVIKNSGLMAKKIMEGAREIVFDESTYEKGSEEYICQLLMPLPYIQLISYTDKALIISFV